MPIPDQPPKMPVVHGHLQEFAETVVSQIQLLTLDKAVQRVADMVAKRDVERSGADSAYSVKHALAAEYERGYREALSYAQQAIAALRHG